MIRCNDDNSVKLYFDGNEKLSTKSDGIDVTGEVQCDSLDVDGTADFTGSVTLHANLDLQDNDNILLGDTDDFAITHDGSNTTFINDTGQIIIRNRADDQDVLLQTDSGTGGVATYIRLDGSTGQVDLAHYGTRKLNTKSDGVDITGELQCDSLDVDGAADITGRVVTGGVFVGDGGDNDTSVSVGNNNDLRLFHDGSNSYVKERGTGSLIVETTAGNIDLKYGSEYLARFKNNAEVELYYDNNLKLETTSSGVTVTGGLQSQRLVITDNGATSPLVSIRSDDASPWALTIGNDTYSTSDRGISFYQDNSGTGYMRMRGDGAWENFYIQTNDGTTTNTALQVDTNRAVLLRYQNNTKLNTKSNGVNVVGELECDSLGVGSALQNSGVASFKGSTMNQINICDSSNSSWGLLLTQSQGNNSASSYHYSTNSGVNKPCAVVNVNNDALHFATNNSARFRIEHDGHVVPSSNNSYDLGSSTYRWRNIYTNDLNLSNEGGGNDVDGTWGNYTIQEGENDLYLINRRNGKKYKFNLTEVN